MENVVADLRERLERRRVGAPGFDSPIERLRRACAQGRGHLLVTGSDRAEIHTLLTRVLDELEPLRAVRTLAVDVDPHATVDRVISALDADVDTDRYLDRREAVLALLERAKEVNKSVFIIVDDADRATIDELETLRSSLDVTPDAFERLRLVLVGDESLAHKLDDPSASALRARITARVKVNDAAVATGASPQPAPPTSHALTLAVASVIAFCAVAYSLYATGLTIGGNPAKPAATVETARVTRAAMYAIRGDEPILTSPLRIAAVSSPSPKKVVAPKPAPRVTSPATVPAPSASASKNTTKPSAPAKTAESSPSPGTSIDAFMKKFPAAR